MVNVWVADAHLSFSQTQIGMRTNEKTAISALLNILNVAGSLISIDTITSQPSTVGKMVERETDCVIALKKNIKILSE